MRRAPGAHTTNYGWRVRQCEAGCGRAARRTWTGTASQPAGDARREITTVRPFYFDRENPASIFAKRHGLLLPRLTRGPIRYLQERRLGVDPNQNDKRATDEMQVDNVQGTTTAKRPRGRPKGSKNRAGKTPSGSGSQAPEAVPV